MQRFDLKMLKNGKVKAKTSTRFAAFENMDDNVGINRAWENIQKIIKLSAKESTGHYKLK
jgi:hypothetical protein